MNYNISESTLRLREYGRNIQSMVDHLKTIADREHRTRLAYELIGFMGNLQPHVKELPDYKQKLWDHLYAISNYELDVDFPFDQPETRMLSEGRSRRMDYYDEEPKFRQYGKNVDLMIAQAVEMPDGDQKKRYINLIANTMKQFLRNIERDSVPDYVIAEHIQDISGGRLVVRVEELVIVKPTPPPKPPVKTNQANKKNRKKKRK